MRTVFNAKLCCVTCHYKRFHDMTKNYLNKNQEEGLHKLHIAIRVLDQREFLSKGMIY